MLAPTLRQAFHTRPPELLNVSDASWTRISDAWEAGEHQASFGAAFDNGRAFLMARDGLRNRTPIRVEWKGPHRPPGDDVIPADLRIDHAYLVSCKYLSKVLLNAGARRLFERLLVGEQRDGVNWFAYVAQDEYQTFYTDVIRELDLVAFPTDVASLSREHQRQLKASLRARLLPPGPRNTWRALCKAVSVATAQIWQDRLRTKNTQLRLLWRMLRISGATYFVLGADPRSPLRFRIDSAWDWVQTFELRHLKVVAREAGQPEVGWEAVVRDRTTRRVHNIRGHVEIRWSHGRFQGFPEAKVYLDTPHAAVPGYNVLV